MIHYIKADHILGWYHGKRIPKYGAIIYMDRNISDMVECKMNHIPPQEIIVEINPLDLISRSVLIFGEGNNKIVKYDHDYKLTVMLSNDLEELKAEYKRIMHLWAADQHNILKFHAEMLRKIENENDLPKDMYNIINLQQGRKI